MVYHTLSTQYITFLFSKRLCGICSWPHTKPHTPEYIGVFIIGRTTEEGWPCLNPKPTLRFFLQNSHIIQYEYFAGNSVSIDKWCLCAMQ